MTDQPIRCENAACPDPGIHAHTIDSRDDLDAARWGGYWPMRLAPCPVCGGTHDSVSCSGVDTPRSRTLASIRATSGHPGTGCIGETCDGCRYCDR